MLQLLSCSVWVTLGAAHRRRGKQLPTNLAEPRKQALCHRHSWPRPSNPPKKDPLVLRDLHAGTTHPASARHPLHRPASAPVGSSVPPHPGGRHSLGSVPTLIFLLFPLEDMPAVSASLGLEGLRTARVKSPWGLPSLQGHTTQQDPSPHAVEAWQRSQRQPAGTPGTAHDGCSTELSSRDSPAHIGTPHVLS